MDKLFAGIEHHDLGQILSGGAGMMGRFFQDYLNGFGLAPMIPDPHQGETHTSHT
jgi:hypothetical protein